MLQAFVPRNTNAEVLPQCETYQSWLDTANPGQQFVYYTGNALSESIIGNILAQLFMTDAKEGKVYLVQKKVAPYTFNHIAVKAPKKPCEKLIPRVAKSFTASQIEYVSKIKR